jgi:GNAT superfamily N-acetyltransferase
MFGEAMARIIFSSQAFWVREATRADTIQLQEFCRNNQSYDVFLTGEVPDQTAWVEEFLTDLPPADFSWTAAHKLIVYSYENPDQIIGVLDVVENMLADKLANIGLFQIAESQYGTGLASELYKLLETWLKDRGADLLRLGVIDGNLRGEAFWKRNGYLFARTRGGPASDPPSHLIKVMYKPLAPMTMDAYRALVPRDHPDAP